jgi:hypothetical protein
MFETENTFSRYFLHSSENEEKTTQRSNKTPQYITHMSNLVEKIATLEAEIEEYKRDLRAAATTEEKREIRVLITASRMKTPSQYTVAWLTNGS